MASLVLTPKTAVKSITTDMAFPTVENTKTDANPAVYDEVTNFAGHGISIPDLAYYALALDLKAVAGQTCTVQFRASDGVTVLCTASRTNTAYGRAWANVVQNTTGAPITGIRAYYKSSVGFGDPFVKEDSLSFVYGDFKNTTDELSIKYQVDTLSFFCCSSAEGMLGIIGNPLNDGFSELTPKTVMNGFIWSANSGNTIYTWTGSKIGVSA